MKEEEKKNPYKLVWFVKGWSDYKTKKNNDKYWAWEIKYNGLTLP